MGLKDLFAAHAGEKADAQHTINVEGMHCNACERLVSDALTEAGATDVVANHETGVVTYAGELEDAVVAEAVTKAGFKVA